MATSGSTDFTTTRAKIIYHALREVNEIGRGEPVSADLARDTGYKLNAMVKNLQATGLHVWTVVDGTLIPAVGQSSYTVGPGATDNVFDNLVTTLLSADEAVGQTVLDVDDTDDIAVNDNAGILLDDGTVQWSTVASKTASTVTIADALTDSAAAGNSVFIYTDRIVRPLKITQARRKNVLTGYETPVAVIAKTDYDALTNKGSAGPVSQLFYQPLVATGVIKLWQVPLAIDERINFTWWRPIEDFDSAGDNPDLPQEWISALHWNLALELATNVSDRVYKRIEKRALVSLDNVMGFDREEGSVYFQPSDHR